MKRIWTDEEYARFSADYRALNLPVVFALLGQIDLLRAERADAVVAVEEQSIPRDEAAAIVEEAIQAVLDSPAPGELPVVVEVEVEQAGKFEEAGETISVTPLPKKAKK